MIVNKVMDIRKEFSKEKFYGLLSMEEFAKLEELYREFSKFHNGPMKVFWDSYLEMVEVLLNAIRATREGNWEMHIESTKEMLPWFYAYDHINYARYLPIYSVNMMSLEESHPEAHTMLANGDFGVQRTTHQGFSQVPVDQTIEQTLNRSTKTKGGIVGFSLKKSAVQRWMLTAHSREAFIDSCRRMTDSYQGRSQYHKENGSSRIKRDEDDVTKITEVIEGWRNPFEASDELVVLSSGRVADENVKQDLLTAKEKGRLAFQTFVNERLVTNAKGFFDTFTKLKLGSFRDAQKKTSVKAGTKNIIIKADRNLFARLLVIGQSRKVDLRELLTFELGPLPWSLASLDGMLAKTNKATLSKLLENEVKCLESLPNPTTAYIIDAMALLQSLVRIPERFASLAEMLMKRVIAVAGRAVRIDFVADQYPDVSIKNTERDKRGSTGKLMITISSTQQMCPRQWKKFLASGSNKTALLNFLANEWTSNNKYAEIIGNRIVFVTHGPKCIKIRSNNGTVTSELCEDLTTNQEEADTRMFLHVAHASRSGHERIAIKSSDTDVEVLACFYSINMPSQLFLESGTQARARIIDVTKVCDSLGSATCRALPGLHALTGCDSVSSFATKGKKKAFDIVQGNQVFRKSVEILGEKIPMANFDQLEQFVCALYNDPKCHSVNDLR